MDTENRMEQYKAALDKHIDDFKRDFYADLELLLSAENLAALLVQDRFIGALQSDVKKFLYKNAAKVKSSGHSNMSMGVISSALTEPMRRECFTVLNHSVRKRLESTPWANDREEFTAAIKELVRKRGRDIIERRVKILRDSVKTLGDLAILLQHRDDNK